MCELAEYMSASDILIVPSLYEPFGLVVLEGMAAGCSMLVSAVGGPDELIEDGSVNGLKVPPGDAGAIKEAFEKLAGNRTLMNEMAIRNRKTGLSNSWKKTAEKLGGLIARITPKRKSFFSRMLDDTLSSLQLYEINLKVQY